MIKLDRLKSQLMTSGLQQKDNSLFQVINQLIDALRQFEISITGITATSSSSGGGLINSSYLTDSDESSSLPNSRQLLAGTNIVFDDTVPNQRTINASGLGSEWSVLTNGDLLYPELIFAGGDVIMLHVP